MAGYRIIDEPRPGLLAQAAVRPYWPLLATMLGGAWIGIPWLVINGLAVGSSRRWQLVLVGLGGLVGAVLLALGIVVLASTDVLTSRMGIQLGMLVLMVWKFGIAYVLYVMQSRDVDLFEYYRGTVRNGLFIVVAAFFLRSHVLGELPALLSMVLR